AGPIIFSQLGAVGMGTMDTIMVGPLGAEALAAIGLAGALHWAMIVVITGTLFGMAPMVSQAFGAGDRERCRRVLVQGLWLAVVLTPPMVVANAAGESIAVALGQDPAIAETVGAYMRALAWGVPPLLLFMAIRQFLEGMGLTRPAMVITFIGLGVNFVGNSMFIYGAGGFVEPMGAVGSGWATTLVRWAMLVAMVSYIFAHPRLHPFRGIGLRPEAWLIRRIVQIGAPTGAQAGLEVGLFSFAAVMMGWFGPTELGTHQVTINIAATTFMVALGFSFAGSILVGQRIGAGDAAGTQRAVLLTYAFVSVSMAVFSVIFLTVPESILRLYTQDAAVVELGVSLLFMAAVFQIFDGTQAAGFSVLRGAADTRVPMLIAAAAYWGVGAPAAYFLAFRTELGASGVWAGLVLGLAAATFLLAWRVRRIHWRNPPGSLAVHPS
ncbi:MAG TPA: MATE family efflux transporter, partial [Candidatus Limnocylindrales bacterium]|nr:MATE family efflux transporter [Candidatus Limnocylindrales bacterium]